MPGSRWSHTTPMLWFSCIVYAWGDILFGIDTGSFGSLQAVPSFLNRFGQTIKGKKALSTNRKSTMNSVPFVGKFVGSMIIEPILERTGFKLTMYFICALQIMAIIIELAAKNWVTFTVGRTFAYMAVGLVENAVPSYNSEICPADVRGFFTGSLLFFNVLGGIWGSGMGRAYATETGNIGWLVPTSMQLIPPVIMLVCIPFTPESPRWLVLHNHRDKAIKELNRLRPKKEVETGFTAAEASALEDAIEGDRLVGSGSWFDLFKGNHFRRTMIACWLCVFEQSTGSQFIVSYLATFLVSLGLGTRSFTYTTVSNVACLVACFIAMILYDKVGRRPVILVGGFLQIIFMIVIAVLGSRPNHSTADINGVVASLILFFVCVRISYQSNCFLIGAEIGGVRLRKKTLALAICVDIIAAVIWTIAVPYMLVRLSAKVGYIFAGISAAAFVFALFFIPELNGRSLEETDELFEMNLWAWQFSDAQTTGVGRRIAMLEEGDGRAEAMKVEALHGDGPHDGKLQPTSLEQA